MTIIHKTHKDKNSGIAIELFTNNAGKSGVRIYDADAGYECTYLCCTYPSFKIAKSNFEKAISEGNGNCSYEVF